MTSEQIEQLANHDGIAAPDMDLQLILRLDVIPEFLMDVGDVSWRRKVDTLTMTVGSKDVNLPDDFFKMLNVVMPNVGSGFMSWEKDRLKYIAEDDQLVAQAEFNTTQSKPGGYRIIQRAITDPGVDSSFRAIRFDAPADQAYAFYYAYLNGPVFADVSTPLDMNAYMPELFQRALVKGLRKEIYANRYGQRDDRYDREEARYRKAVDRAMENAEQGQAGQRMKFAS